MALLPCFLLAVTFAAGVASWRKLPGQVRRIECMLWFLSVLGALGAWFVGAPAIRFGSAMIWQLLAACLAIVLMAHWSERSRMSILGLLFLLVALGISDRLGPVLRSVAIRDIDNVRAAVWLPGGPDWGMYPTPQPKLHIQTLPSGVLFHEPAMQECPDSNWHPCLAWAPPLPGGSPRLNDLAYLKPEVGAVGGFRMSMPEEGWARKYAREVQEARTKTAASIRVLALRFRVHPKVIQQALDSPLVNGH